LLLSGEDAVAKTSRVGGRVATLQTQYGPVELGALLIHGQPKVLT
jgi:hypothetical protein